MNTAKYFAPYLLALFSKRYELAAVKLGVTNGESLLAHLATNDCDMVIMGVPPYEQDFVAEPFMENPLW